VLQRPVERSPAEAADQDRQRRADVEHHEGGEVLSIDLHAPLASEAATWPRRQSSVQPASKPPGE